MSKFRMRPSVEFEAFRWTVDQVPDWWKDLSDVAQARAITVPLPSGGIANPGDYIVRDHTGRVFVIRREQFESEYIPADEPVFEVLGRDQLAQATVVHWIERAVAAGSPEAKIERARQRYNEIVNFQSEHPERIKVPD